MSAATNRNADYWNRKLAALLHDPPDKALHIPGHEERSAGLLDAFGLGDISPDKGLYGRADAIASGMDRTQVPGYVKNDQTRNGAVDFSVDPQLTHPTGANQSLRITLPSGVSVKETHPAMTAVIRQDMDTLSGRFAGKPDQFAAARFHYAHLLLRERLAADNAGGLGGLWYKIPADTRVPDHSVWQHCGLVSALTTCFAEPGQGQASLMVVALTPVQDFIGRARKLRDLWTGSVILSWLVFEGVRRLVHGLGADHILYPSLSGQPLTAWMLDNDLGLGDFVSKTTGDDGVASFPNKFVCLVPAGQEERWAEETKEAMLAAWTGLGETVLDLVERKTRKDKSVRAQFERQMASYFSVQWSACPLLTEGKQDAFKRLLPESVWGLPLAFHEHSKKSKLDFPAKGEGAFYPVTHALAQSGLAAGKAVRVNGRPDEPGIKCGLHGDLEIIHFAEETGKNPPPKDDPFWKALRQVWDNATNFKESERLSSVALVKRLACEAIRRSDKKHPLAIFFNDADSFPSSTEVALTDWLDGVKRRGLHEGIGGKRWRQKLAQYVHIKDEGEPDETDIADLSKEEQDTCRTVVKKMAEAKAKIADSDKYYAILLMDGDKMGDLVNGETLAATWANVLHPDLVRRFKEPTFAREYREFWQKFLGERRLLAPAVHAAISEALGDFALHAVPGIVKRHRGCLIYAGGDDVCAVLPVSSALAAAQEIAAAYRMGFVVHGDSGFKEIGDDVWIPTNGRLATHLGHGDMISISAGILIVHHKRPLAGAMRQAHALLEKAKEEGGRNAFAVELAKRSGGSRFFVAKWDETPARELALGGDAEKTTLLDHFHSISRASAGREGETLSSSLLYKFGDLQPGIQSVLEKWPEGLPPLVVALMRKKQDDENWLRLARSAAALLGRRDLQGKGWRLDHAPLVIARFLGTLTAQEEQQGRTTP
ncbi:MAG TPA: type III-B CRISPR-associated protein Cas10/Cmr2 [Desulfobacteraceae bacterium]|nr:type III-B CRISPR-associated protein Cas10/Cmr2 [Desulfobacteraceae bacterium]